MGTRLLLLGLADQLGARGDHDRPQAKPNRPRGPTELRLSAHYESTPWPLIPRYDCEERNNLGVKSRAFNPFHANHHITSDHLPDVDGDMAREWPTVTGMNICTHDELDELSLQSIAWRSPAIRPHFRDRRFQQITWEHRFIVRCHFSSQVTDHN